MPHWNDGTRWGTARWAPPAPLTKMIRPMATIALNVSKLPIATKIVRGQDIITKSTGNPNVPGNTAVLTAFSNAQEDMLAANDAYEAIRLTVEQLLTARNTALFKWLNELTALAAFTQSVTGGDAEKLLSAGFEIRGSATPKPPLNAPANLQARTNGMPGVTKLSWNPLGEAVAYVVEHSAAPEGPYTQVAMPTKASCEVEGAEPGKESWYRVAGLNADGQGPFCEPARRPVL